MAKTKQIGVRFTQDLLEATGLTPQKALNEYEKSHALFIGKKVNDKIEYAICSVAADEKQLTTLAKETTEKSFDGKIVDTNFTDEISQFEIPKETTKKAILLTDLENIIEKKLKKKEEETTLILTKNEKIIFDNLYKKILLYPTEYNGWLRMAKEGVEDADAFKVALTTSKLNAAQKSMILSKIK